MKQLKPATLFLAAALGAITLGAFTLNACGEPSSGLNYLEEAGDTSVKKGGGSGEAVAGLNVEFKTQGGNWLSQDIPENFWETVINDDATVNLPSAYIKRGGMILAGWYDRPQPMSEPALNAYIARTRAENENPPPSEDPAEDPSDTPPAEDPPEPAPYLLSGEPVPEEGRFTEKTKLIKSITLYAWWQQLENGAKIVTFIPYWMEGSQGFKRQAVLQEDEITYKVAPDSFPQVTGGPEHYHPDPSGATWWTDAGEEEESVQFTADSAVTEDMTVYGRWAGDKYKITFHTNAAQVDGVSDETFEVETSYPNPATPPENKIPKAPDGYTFLGWRTEQKGLITDADVPAPGDKGWFEPGVTPVVESLSVYGVWQNRPAGSYRVTFKSYYEAGNSISTAYAGGEDGYKVSVLPNDSDVKREHYTRDGSDWYYTPEQGGGGDSSAKFDADTRVEEDIIVYAKWNGKTYTVTFKSRIGQEQKESTTYSYSDNDPAKLSPSQIPQVADTSPHYTSDGKWYMEGGDTFSANTVITQDLIVTPKWEGKTYTVTFLGGGGTLSTQTMNATYPPNTTDAKPTTSLGSLPVASRANYTFKEWRTATDDSVFTKDTTVTGNITVTAQWTFAGYKLTFDGNGATTAASPAAITVGAGVGPSGVKAQLPASIPKRTGYLFDGWYPGADGGGIKVTTTTVVSADTKYYAKWVSVPSDWDYNSTTGGMSRTFEYKGYEQNFTVLVEGSYTFELSGAAGGVNYGRTSLRAKGGFSKGTIKTLPKNTMLYVYVGGRGGDSATSTGTTTAGAGGWNGGGAGGSGVEADSVKYSGGGGGGGATDIRFVSGTDATALKSRIIVAGGGGGLGQDYNSGSTSGNKGKGGAGGGASGGDGFDNGAAAATNAAGGKQDSGNVFGTGATGGNGNNATNSAEGHGGGGGGYYGGKARSTSTGTKQICGGGGGSGFVYGYYSTAGNQSSYPVPAAYQSYRFTSDMACTAGDGSNGNGSAKVTYTPIP